MSFVNRLLFTNRALGLAQYKYYHSGVVMAYSVKHSEEKKLFYIDLENDEQAVITYEKTKGGVVDLQHTEVPDSHRGKGIAKVLAKEALEHFTQQQTKMKLSCWYLQKYHTENPHPDTQKYVVP